MGARGVEEGGPTGSPPRRACSHPMRFMEKLSFHPFLDGRVPRR